MSTRNPTPFILGVALFILFTHPAGQARSETPEDASMAAAFDDLVGKGFTGFAMVARKGQVIFARGADSNARVFTQDTPIDILSMTKSFTGMAVGLLMVRDLVRPQTPLGEIFADLPADKTGITLHQLLTHTSGLPHALGEDHEVLDRANYLARAWSTPLEFAPGSRYSYSNVGYSVLAAVIEEVTGLTFEDFLRREILVPLGLQHTGYAAVLGPDDPKDFRRAARESWGGLVPSWHLMGNGGMLSTPRDLLTWVLAAESQDGETRRVRDLTHQPYQREGQNATSHYGYGLVVEDIPQRGPLHWHNGGSRVANGHWRYFARQEVAIVITSDQWEVTADTMAEALSSALTP